MFEAFGRYGSGYEPPSTERLRDPLELRFVDLILVSKSDMTSSFQNIMSSLISFCI